MDYTEVLGIKKGAAVCYSGYRNGQRPGHIYPSYDEVKEDLFIIKKQWQYIRLYSCDEHSKTVLEVIKREICPKKSPKGSPTKLNKMVSETISLNIFFLFIPIAINIPNSLVLSKIAMSMVFKIPKDIASKMIIMKRSKL